MAEPIERPSKEDFEAVYQLLVRSDVAEYGEADSERNDLEQAWSQLDLRQDAWLVKQEGGEPLGYAAVIPSRGELRFEVYVDPAHGSTQLASELLKRCEQRAKELSQEREIVAHSFLAHVNQRDQKIYSGAGFAFVKSYYQMHITLHDDLEQPRWPEGVTVRSAVRGVDEEDIYSTVQIAFERPPDERPTYEQWFAHMIRPELYDPALWFLAMAEDAIVGTCLGINYETEGWIRQFGVIPGWRGRGIATALLRHSFLAFHRRGYARVGLGMEAKNQKALRLYARVGMKVLRQYDEYRKVYSSIS